MAIHFQYKFDWFRAPYEDSYGGFEYDFSTIPDVVSDTMISIFQYLYPQWSNGMPKTFKEFENPRELVSEYELFEVEEDSASHRYAEARFSILLTITKKEFIKITENPEMVQMIKDSGIKVMRTKTKEMDWDNP